MSDLGSGKLGSGPLGGVPVPAFAPGRRRVGRRPPHAEGAEEVAPAPKELRQMEETARKEAGVRRAKEMLERGEIWKPGFPGIFGRR